MNWMYADAHSMQRALRVFLVLNLMFLEVTDKNIASIDFFLQTHYQLYYLDLIFLVDLLSAEMLFC